MRLQIIEWKSYSYITIIKCKNLIMSSLHQWWDAMPHFHVLRLVVGAWRIVFSKRNLSPTPHAKDLADAALMVSRVPSSLSISIFISYLSGDFKQWTDWSGTKVKKTLGKSGLVSPAKTWHHFQILWMIAAQHKIALTLMAIAESLAMPVRRRCLRFHAGAKCAPVVYLVITIARFLFNTGIIYIYW